MWPRKIVWTSDQQGLSILKICSTGCFSGGSKQAGQVSFNRHVPKFLQGHMHLLGRKPAVEEDPAVAVNNAVESDDDDRADEDEVVRIPCNKSAHDSGLHSF